MGDIIATAIFCIIFGALIGFGTGFNVARGMYVTRGLQGILLVLTNLPPAQRVELIRRLKEQREQEGHTQKS